MVLNFQKDVSLLPYNTFGIDVKSKKFVSVRSTDELKAVLNQNQEKRLLVLGGGSNLLLTKDFDGLTLRIENRGIQIVHEEQRSAKVKCCRRKLALFCNVVFG